MQKIFLAVLAIIILVGAFFFFTKPSNANPEDGDGNNVTSEINVTPTGVVHKMVLREDGYEPRDISINLSDTIEFSTTEGRPYWPASNVHPTHRLYSEFDPKEPVMPEDTWSFVFDRVGEWRYHDHIAPFYTGVITVVDSSE